MREGALLELMRESPRYRLSEPVEVWREEVCISSTSDEAEKMNKVEVLPRVSVTERRASEKRIAACVYSIDDFR